VPLDAVLGEVDARDADQVVQAHHKSLAADVHVYAVVIVVDLDLPRLSVR